MALHFVHEDPASGSVASPSEREVEEKTSKSWPGHGLPLTASRLHASFPNALFGEDSEVPILTVREYTMMEIMNRVTDKPSWETKVFDDTIASKWKAELLAQKDKDISEKMVDESIAELKYKAKAFKATNIIETLDGVFKSDTIIPENVRLALIDAVAPLENVPEDQKDWHPRSNGKVLDLVHPSIYPLVYGQTRIVPEEATNSLEDWRRQFGVGDTLAAGQNDEGHREWSAKFQWLPCEVDVSLPTVKIVSYINNLQPQKHRNLYSIIEKVIEYSIPLWNRTLGCLSEQRWSKDPRIVFEGDGYGEVTEPEPQFDGGEENDTFHERYEAWKNRRPILQPEPRTFEPPEREEFFVERPSVSLRSDYGYPDSRIQVIVKLANIYLTPESPNYEGGSWHVEGAGNENICASAIYYYESENISESLLSFRQQVEDNSMDMIYEQDDHRAMETIYGFENEAGRIQNLGSVVTRQSRLITFPNIMQHRVNPFHLDDPSRPGHRKILALFLVDPHQRIISTANVPPQQEEWWEEHLALCEMLHARLPQELSENVIQHIWKPVSLEVAKEQRLELMDERSVFVREHNHDFEHNRGTFSLCEH